MLYDPTIYRKAYALYLRRGTALDLSLKASAHPTPYYIWRTRSDNKVRNSHAANNGKIFAWDTPPPTGNPGEDYGCRCTAEAYTPILYEYANQIPISTIDEGLDQWQWYDFVFHFYFGKGQPIDLSQIGHLNEIVRQAHLEVFSNLSKQIAKEARIAGNAQFSYEFDNTYSFLNVSFVHGDSEIKGSFRGAITPIGEMLHVIGTIEYQFSDEFTDPLDIRQIITNTPSDIFSLISKIAAQTNYSVEELIKLYRASPKYSSEDIAKWVASRSETGGIRYGVYGRWSTEFRGVFLKDRTRSHYLWKE